MRQYALNQSSTVTLDANGDGTTPEIGPTAQGETWTVSIISVKASSNVNEAIASAYLNGTLLGTTTWGSTGDSDTGITVTLAVGQVITATWTGGDPGAVGTVSVLGTRSV